MRSLPRVTYWKLKNAPSTNNRTNTKPKTKHWKSSKKRKWKMARPWSMATLSLLLWNSKTNAISLAEIERGVYFRQEACCFKHSIKINAKPQRVIRKHSFRLCVKFFQTITQNCTMSPFAPEGDILFLRSGCSTSFRRVPYVPHIPRASCLRHILYNRHINRSSGEELN